MFFFRKKPETEITDIESLHYWYSTGTMIDSYVYYDLKIKDDKYIAEIKPNNVPEENKITTEIKEEDIKKITELLKKYHVNKWNGFHKTDQNVLDGNSFSLNIYFKNGTSISASGYMIYPDNYREVCNELDNIFLSYYNN